MIVTPIEIPLWLPESKTPRSPGVHVSSIIRCVATEYGILKPEWAEELSLVDVRTITDQVALVRISIGLAWEEWYIPNILSPSMGVIDHPGEREVDGIYMTHDGESISTITTDKRNHYAVHEVKATYKSTKTVGDLESQWMYLAQMKAYCQALRTRWAFLHCLFLCGDYTFPIKPLLRCWEVEFTQQEIDENWQMLRQYRDDKI
jgi:hypothetical protein